MPDFRRVARGAAGFTIAEMMVAMTVFLMLLAGVMSAHLFGLKLFELTRLRLTASEQSRRVMNRLKTDVTSANDFAVGSGSLSAFTAVGAGLSMTGNTVQIYPGTNRTVYSRYFFDQSDKYLKRMTNGMATPEPLAGPMRNPQNLFRVETITGAVAVSGSEPNNALLGITLDFAQSIGSISNVVAGQLAKYYVLEANIAPRKRE